ncbi:hypothetical protein M5D96_006117, partial [Drosophila gunungcola]
DKLNVAQAHPMLGKAFVLEAGDTYKEIQFEERPIPEWSAILALCGSSVYRISCQAANKCVVVAILASKFCPNVEEFFFPLNQLEELILQNSYITNSGIIILLGHCKKLRRLDLFACHNITKDVVLPAVAILKMNGVQTDNPLVITVGDEFGATNESLWCGVLVIKKHTQFSWNLL